MKSLIDIGINLTDRRFNEDRDDVVKRALEHDISTMIITGTSIWASEEAAKFAKKYPGVLYSTAGIHPHAAKNANSDSIHALRRIAEQKEVVAIGECGLDFDRDISPRGIQETCFREQLFLARELDMPLFLHERDAHNRFIEVMNQFEDLIPKSVVHCFTGTEEEVKEYLDRGFYIGITGWICNTSRSQDLRKAVRHIPLEKLLIETDGPYLTPRGIQPKPKNNRNESMYLPYVVKELAICMDRSEDEIAKASTENTKRFFRLER